MDGTQNATPAKNATPTQNATPAKNIIQKAPSVPIQAPSESIQAPSVPIQAPSESIQAPSAPIQAPSAPIQAQNASQHAKNAGQIKGKNARATEIAKILQNKLAANTNNQVQNQKISNLANKYSGEITGNMTPAKLGKMVDYLASKNNLTPFNKPNN